MLSKMILGLFASHSISNYAYLISTATAFFHAKKSCVYVLKQHQFVPFCSTVSSSSPITKQQAKIYKKVLDSRSPQIIARVKTLSPSSKMIGKQEKNLVCVPLAFGSTALGVLVFQMLKVKKTLSSKDRLSLKIFGSLVCLMLVQDQLEQRFYQTRKDQDLLIASTAHDLRTPLTALHVYLRLSKRHEKNTQKLLWLNRISEASKKIQFVADSMVNTHLKEVKNGANS